MFRGVKLNLDQSLISNVFFLFYKEKKQRFILMMISHNILQTVCCVFDI